MITSTGKYEGLDIPIGLSRKGRKAAAIIKKIAKKHKMTDTGGCRAFYTPDAWKRRGEDYGRESELVVCHDGGGLFSIMSHYREMPQAQDDLIEALKKAGLYYEPCTGWYSAIYGV